MVTEGLPDPDAAGQDFIDCVDIATGRVLSRRQHVVALVAKLGSDDTADGILVQHPMPPQVDERQECEATTTKDVDGVAGASFVTIARGDRGFASSTPGGGRR